LQALAASGLRALRYAQEVEGIGKVVALDIEEGTLSVLHISPFLPLSLSLSLTHTKKNYVNNLSHLDLKFSNDN
jgi:N2,N2-dimethylguanosine tRNA methyltransferase